MPQIKVHFTAWALVFLVSISLIDAVNTLPALANAILAVSTGVAFLGAVLFHELAHLFAGRLLGFKPQSVTLFGLGGFSQFENSLWIRKSGTEILIAVAGPASSLLLWLSAIGLASFIEHPAAFYLKIFGVLNLYLGGFNLLPLFPLDGGRVFRSLLGFRIERIKATRITAILGLIGCVSLPIAAWAIYQDLFSVLWMGLISLFLIGANVTALRNPGQEI